MAGGGYTRPEPLRGKHVLEGFSCGEPSLDRWLLKYSRQAEATGSSRVFVTTDDGSSVIGFHALAAGTVAPGDATTRLMKGQPSGRPIPIILLTRLAVDVRDQDQGVGASLLQDAMLKAHVAATSIGARALAVHAVGADARLWYERWGFEPSPTDGHHLILLMKDLAKLLESPPDRGERPAPKPSRAR